jgi:hypothetical protein
MFFRDVPMTKVLEDGKVLVTLVTVDQSHKYVELTSCLSMRVIRKPWDRF